MSPVRVTMVGSPERHQPRSGPSVTVSSRAGALPWPLAGVLLLTLAGLHPVWPGRAARLVGDFCSHTLYLSAIAGAAAVLLSFALARRSRHLLWWPLSVGLGTFLWVEGLKRLTQLPRPEGQPTGFPSGHTTLMFALAWLLSRIHPRLSALWFAVAVSVGWARMEGMAHFPYQVVCGAALGTAIGAWVSRHGADGRGARGHEK